MRVLLVCLLAGLAFASAARLGAAEGRYATVKVEPVKTSIYIGSVTLTSSPLKRQGAAYNGTYTAKVFPFFFSSEAGTLTLEASDEQLRRLERGEVVDFTGSARNEDGEPRRVEGRATPTDATGGRIKVRIFVSKKIELIFNTTYRFGG